MPLDQGREGQLRVVSAPRREALQQLPIGQSHGGPRAEKSAQAMETVRIAARCHEPDPPVAATPVPIPVKPPRGPSVPTFFAEPAHTGKRSDGRRGVLSPDARHTIFTFAEYPQSPLGGDPEDDSTMGRWHRMTSHSAPMGPEHGSPGRRPGNSAASQGDALGTRVRETANGDPLAADLRQPSTAHNLHRRHGRSWGEEGTTKNTTSHETDLPDRAGPWRSSVDSWWVFVFFVVPSSRSLPGRSNPCRASGLR